MKLGYTILYVADVAASVAFYERAFGVSRRFLHESGTYAEMETGATALAFASRDLVRGNGVPFAEPAEGRSPPMEVGFVTDDVAGAFRAAVAAGAVPVVEPTRKPWGQTVSYVRDPDGFLVEICSPVAAAEHVIRPVAPADTAALVATCLAAGVFPPEAGPTLTKLFDDYHASNHAAGHRALVYEEAGEPVGVVYLAPREMADRTWELLMMMVDAAHHGRGVGSRLMAAVEAAVKDGGGRLLLIETSSTSEFERTRKFYRRHGYAEVATVPDYYADGDGKVSFVKRIV